MSDSQTEQGARGEAPGPYHLDAALRPFVIARAAVAERLHPAPLGRAIEAADRLDPTRRVSAPMLDRIQRLDAVLFGPRGMATPRWALYDCAGLPGVIAGLGVPEAALPSPLRAALSIPEGDAGLSPVAMVLATPTLEEGSWLLYALGWLDGVVQDLGVVAAAAAVELLRARRITFTAQWASPELAALARFAPLEILAAWLPAHDHPASCVLRCDVDEARIARALASVSARSAAAAPGVPPDPAGRTAIDARDTRALEALQGDIEAGRAALLAGPPEAASGALLLPVITSPLEEPP